MGGEAGELLVGSRALEQLNGALQGGTAGKLLVLLLENGTRGGGWYQGGGVGRSGGGWSVKVRGGLLEGIKAG